MKEAGDGEADKLQVASPERRYLLFEQTRGGGN